MSQAQYNAIFSNLFKKSAQDQNQLPANLQKLNMLKANANNPSVTIGKVTKKFKPNLAAYKKDNDAKPYESSLSFSSTPSSTPSWASVQQPGNNDLDRRLQSQIPSEDVPLGRTTSLMSEGNKLFKLNAIAGQIAELLFTQIAVILHDLFVHICCSLLLHTYTFLIICRFTLLVS